MKTAIAAAAFAAGLTLAACGGTGTVAPRASAHSTTQLPTAAACEQLKSGMATMPMQEGPARAAAIRQIAAAAVGTPLASLVRRWQRDVSTSPAAISRMSRNQAIAFELDEANFVGEVHGTCLTAGVPGVMGN
jgi:hypothetical protein